MILQVQYCNIFSEVQMKNQAFTIAEILITLGIIGIIAAITLSTVIKNTQDKQFRVMFKKQFSIISQAFQMVYLASGEEIQFDEWREMQIYVCQIGQKLKADYSGIKCDEILSNFDPNNNYGRPDKKFRWHADNTWYNAKKQPMRSNPGYNYMTFYLPDGAWINFNCSRYVFVDVNGAKKPNTVGRDIFYFVIPRNSNSPSFFFGSSSKTYVNGCQGGQYQAILDRNNYKEDCLNGTGWGCSPMYILD